MNSLTKNILTLIFFLAFIVIVIGCGKQKHELKIDDSVHTGTISGEAKNRIIVEMQFIGEIKQLCKELHLQSDYSSKKLYKQAVAQCTFDNLAILNLDLNSDQLQNTINELCQQPQYQNEAICL